MVAETLLSYQNQAELLVQFIWFPAVAQEPHSGRDFVV
jgi:hypothetical protein